MQAFPEFLEFNAQLFVVGSVSYSIVEIDFSQGRKVNRKSQGNFKEQYEHTPQIGRGEGIYL